MAPDSFSRTPDSELQTSLSVIFNLCNLRNLWIPLDFPLWTLAFFVAIMRHFAEH